MFGTQHLIALLIIFSLAFAVFYFRDTLKSPKYFDKVRYILAAIILLQEVSLHIYRISFGLWDITTSLPLHLCSFGVLTSAYLLISNNKNVTKYIYLIAMLGAFMAVATPAVENNVSFPHYRFIQTFVSHGLIFVNYLFILVVMDHEKVITYKSLYYNFISLVVLAVVLYGFNTLTGSNYMYLMGKPGEGTAFDLFGEYPWYLVNIFFFGIPVLFHLFYVPFFVRDYLNKRNQLVTQN
jgi:hypothetical integral membrane protein (TIGR02206 family)